MNERKYWSCPKCWQGDISMRKKICDNCGYKRRIKKKDRKIAEKIRIRDGYICYKCNKYFKDIHVHHIFSKTYYLKHKSLLKENGFNGINDKKNLICLCKNCHKTIENSTIQLGITSYIRKMLDTAYERSL